MRLASGLLATGVLCVSALAHAADSSEPSALTTGQSCEPIWPLLSQADWLMLELSTPGGLDRVSVDESGEVRFVSMRRFQDGAPAEVVPLQPQSLSLRQSQSARLAAASIFRGAPRSNVMLSRRTSPLSVRTVRQRVSTDRVLGGESKARATTDLGSLVGRSSRSRGVSTQKRNPIITDPRVRGSRVGQMAASGSHWVPARIDLDTILSKVDSRIVDDVVVVKGPYASRFGPGSDFIDFQLITSPRSNGEFESGGATSVDYRSNGEQFYGRQTFTAADVDWGLRFGYGHRAGTDYESGAGVAIPSGYKSRDIDIALGFDVSPGRNIEFSYLRLDQTDVELPGQAFDIDTLVTDGFKVSWLDGTVTWADLLAVESWYNQTRLKGSAQSAGKRQTFPFLDQIQFVGNTNIDSKSTGARVAATWEHSSNSQTTAGADVRIVRQELDEITSGQIGFVVFSDANSPIPRSLSANPGLFVEHTQEPIDGLDLTAGLRVDAVKTEVLDPADVLDAVGTAGLPLANILGTGEFDQSFGLWSAFTTAEYELDQNWTLRAGAGYGMRPPSLTEMYVAEAFMFLLQSGLNTVTGDPRLDAERRWQIDLGTEYSDGRLSARANVFHAWIHDRITFENVSVRRGPPFNQVEQTNLKYINTDRATLLGFEADAEFDASEDVSLFGSMSYVQGTDHTRNGDFATVPADGLAVTESIRVPGVARGAFSGINGPSREPLPGIPPLESRLGIRLNGAINDGPVSVELSSRIVNDQDRIARSLLESETPGFTTWDIRTFWQATNQLTIVAGVENLTDKDYREHFDFRSLTGRSIRQPGRNFYFGSQLVY